MSKELITVTAKHSEKEFDIDWGVIRRGIETLQKLAPPDLRQPPEFLDDLYECKRTLKKIFDHEKELLDNEIEKTLKQHPDDDMALNPNK